MRATTLMPEIEQTVQRALAHHRNGELVQAERLYREVLQTQAQHADANHHLGMLLVQDGRSQAALPHLKTAVQANPAEGRHWLSYAEGLLASGNAQEALAIVDEARRRGLQGAEIDVLRERAAAETWLGPDQSEVDRLGALFSANRHAEAEALARKVIQAWPNHGFSWKVLGTALTAQQRFAEAVPVLDKTLSLLHSDPETHNNLGAALRACSRLAEAEASFRRAIKIKPDFHEAYNNLGNTLQALGRLLEAEASYRRALELKPDFDKAHSNLGNVLRSLGRLSEAETSYRRALELNPESSAAHGNLGYALFDLGRLSEAEASCRRALELEPNYHEAHDTLGNILCALDRFPEAEASYRRSLQIKPDFYEAHSNLGNALERLGRLAEAEASYRRALELEPDSHMVYSNLGNLLTRLGRLTEAEASCRHALKLMPDFHEAYNNLGNVLLGLGRVAEAEMSYRRALELAPDLHVTHSNLGIALQALGRPAEAETSYRRALELKPDYHEAFTNLLFCLSHDESVDAQALFAEHCRFGEVYEAPLRAHWPQHTNSRVPERCLHIGFVSGDLRGHAVAAFLEPLLAHLAGYPQLSLHGYSNHAVEDDVTERLRVHFAHWHRIIGMSDEALAEAIRGNAIDILIDLSGHTAKHRLLTFARKPAPIQASWIGYPGTTGLSAMDYYLADKFFLPTGQFEGQFTEKIVRLPASVPLLSLDPTPPVNPLPALSNGFVTLGSFNRPSKLSPSVIACWSQLLRALPDARMVLGAMPTDGNSDPLSEWFAREDIPPERLSFHARCDMDSYLEMHKQVDLCLDTNPYTGGTTTYYALLMGVPTLTLAGRTVPGRQSAAFLGRFGLESFVADDPADFVRKGVTWARNLSALAELRAGLSQRVLQSFTVQPAMVAAGLERALRTMWRRWCAGLPAASFDLQQRDISSPLGLRDAQVRVT